jgi:hypothetical protein
MRPFEVFWPVTLQTFLEAILTIGMQCTLNFSFVVVRYVYLYPGVDHPFLTGFCSANS